MKSAYFTGKCQYQYYCSYAQPSYDLTGDQRVKLSQDANVCMKLTICVQLRPPAGGDPHDVQGVPQEASSLLQVFYCKSITSTRGLLAISINLWLVSDLAPFRLQKRVQPVAEEGMDCGILFIGFQGSVYQSDFVLILGGKVRGCGSSQGRLLVHS